MTRREELQARTAAAGAAMRLAMLDSRAALEALRQEAADLDGDLFTAELYHRLAALDARVATRRRVSTPEKVRPLRDGEGGVKPADRSGDQARALPREGALHWERCAGLVSRP